ncbi:MAG: antitoxin [Verrucomicrobiales bacterium]|nr:antitoxin [Verrucomicrobiales bacterium]
MRTTLTLEPDVADRLKEELEAANVPFKTVVNEALRRGLGMKKARERRPFVVRPHSSAFVAGTDLARLNQLVDALEVEEFQLAETARA